jgi:hypothetical protein
MDDGRHDRGLDLRTLFSFEARARRKRVYELKSRQILSRRNRIVPEIAPEQGHSAINRPEERTLS